MKRLRVVVAALAVLSTLLIADTRPAGAIDAAETGACAMTLNASFGPSLTMTPTPTGISINGSGLCVISGFVSNGYFSAFVGTPPAAGMTCLTGVATGLGSFNFDHPLIPGASGGTVVVANVGGVLTIAFQWRTYVFIAVGEFVPVLPGQGDCILGSQSHVSLTGVFAINDPTLPVDIGV